MNANWDLAKELIEAGADVDQWDIFGEAPLFTAIGALHENDGGRASIDPPNETKGMDVIRLLLERGANPNMQLFFRPANVRGSTNHARLDSADPRGEQRRPRGRAAACSSTAPTRRVYMADRQTPIHAVLAGRASEKDALELIRVLHEAGTDVNVVALVVHIEEVRGGIGAALRGPQALQGRHPGCSRPTAST